MYTTSSPSVLSVCICLNFCGIRVCLVNSYQFSHILLFYLVFYMLYQCGANFCLLSLRIRSVPFLGTSSDLVTRLATLQCHKTPLVVIFSTNSVHLSILCIICYRQREGIVTCEIVVIPMNSWSIVLTCIKSLLLFNHCICTFDSIFYICELSFNRDFVPYRRAFDMSNKYY